MNPDHYKGDERDIQPIDLIESQNLGFHEGNVVKYVCRYQRKNGKQDLEKAIDYLQRLIRYKYPDES